MNVRVMKPIDHYIGIPVCFILNFVQMVVALFPRKAVRYPEKNLIMKYFGVGVVISTFSRKVIFSVIPKNISLLNRSNILFSLLMTSLFNRSVYQ